MKNPLGLYLYPCISAAAMAGFVSAMWAGVSGNIGLHDSLLGILLSLLVGWAAAARFDRIESRMGGAE
jgi:hypothetical protein